MRREIEEIKKRNKRVEADKAWEISKTRRILLTVATYFIVAYWLILIEAPNPWVNAVVPSAAFILSTLTLPFLKRWWIKNVYKKK